MKLRSSASFSYRPGANKADIQQTFGYLNSGISERKLCVSRYVNGSLQISVGISHLDLPSFPVFPPQLALSVAAHLSKSGILLLQHAKEQRRWDTSSKWFGRTTWICSPFKLLMHEYGKNAVILCLCLNALQFCSSDWEELRTGHQSSDSEEERSNTVESCLSSLSNQEATDQKSDQPALTEWVMDDRILYFV